MPQNSDSVADSPIFSTKAVRKAIRTLESILGRANVDALIYDLETYGLPLTNDHKSYTLAEIQSAIEKVFGNEATLLIFRHISQELFETK